MKLRKIWNKMKLWEVSACGIPMYPAAHKSLSLNKIQAGKGDELKLEEKPMEETEESKVEAEKEEAKDEGKSEDSESESEQEPETSEEDAEKSVKDFASLIAKGFREAIREVSTERGFVQTESLQDQMDKELKKKSIGELAVMSGLFQKPAVIGANRGFE